MGNSIAGTAYTGTGSSGSGAQSVTNVVIPSGVSIAIVSLHWFDATDSPGSITLDGQTVTIVSNAISASNDSVKLGWATGMAAGSGKTLAYTNSGTITTGVGIRIAFLGGSETVSPIRDQEEPGVTAIDGNVDFTGMAFTSGDWTIIATSSDLSGVLLDGGANTELVPESQAGNLHCGQAYRTDGSDIGTPSSPNSFLAAGALVVKTATGGPSAGTDTATAGLSESLNTVSVTLSIQESG